MKITGEISNEPVVKFETLEEHTTKFGKKNFLEVAKKRAINGANSNIFMSISRGFYGDEGKKKYKATIALPLEKSVIESISNAMLNMIEHNSRGLAERGE